MSSLRVNRLPVKPSRRTARPAGRFGEGLSVPFVPYYGRQPFSAADLAWWARMSNEDSEGLTDAEIDRQAAESAAFDAITAGCYA